MTAVLVSINIPFLIPFGSTTSTGLSMWKIRFMSGELSIAGRLQILLKTTYKHHMVRLSLGDAILARCFSTTERFTACYPHQPMVLEDILSTMHGMIWTNLPTVWYSPYTATAYRLLAPYPLVSVLSVGKTAACRYAGMPTQRTWHGSSPLACWAHRETDTPPSCATPPITLSAD